MAVGVGVGVLVGVDVDVFVGVGANSPLTTLHAGIPKSMQLNRRARHPGAPLVLRTRSALVANSFMASLRGRHRPSRGNRTDRHPSHASVWGATSSWARAQS